MVTAKVCAVVKPAPRAANACGKWAQRLSGSASALLVVGGRQDASALEFQSADDLANDAQQQLGFRLTSYLPADSHSRKNLGYLRAIQQQTQCIYDISATVAPTADWQCRSLDTKAIPIRGQGWFNPLAPYTSPVTRDTATPDRPITGPIAWPLGFPLEALQHQHHFKNATETPEPVQAPIQVGLVQGQPQVDQICAWVVGARIDLGHGPSRSLGSGIWTPFLGESVWWWEAAFPLMYLPSTCSPHCSEVWRSLIAQRCLWECNKALVIHAAEVERSDAPDTPHARRNLQDDIQLMTASLRLAQILEGSKLRAGPSEISPNLLRCYRALVVAGVIDRRELQLVECWLDDLQSLQATSARAA